MPLKGGFLFMFGVGCILFTPFTFPRSLFRKARKALKARREEKQKKRNSFDPLFMTARIKDTLNKRGGISVWPVQVVQSNKTKLWNELNDINEYVFHLIVKKNDKISELKEELAKKEAHIKSLQEPSFHIPIFDQEPTASKAKSNTERDVELAFKKTDFNKPLSDFFDVRICNLLFQYDNNFPAARKISKLGDLFEVSRKNLYLMRGVGPHTIEEIEKVLNMYNVKLQD